MNKPIDWITPESWRELRICKDCYENKEKETEKYKLPKEESR